jgi:4-amino-4-deoxy-L-arabinose transferase-like glycosyltransferase
VRPSPIVLLILGTTLLRLAFAASTGLGVDESYMIAAGRVLSLGYFDHPPASWWLSWGASHLFGTEAPVVVRLPFILLFALSQALTYRITCLIADRRAAFWAVVLLNLSPVFGVTTGSWVLPDGPLDAALLAAALCLLHALDDGRTALRWWAGAGVCAGLALFSKYTAVLTIAGALLYLVFSARDRRWLTRPEPYVAVAMAALVFAPVLVWNATHHWASFAFQGNRAAGLGVHPLRPFAVVAGEALFVLPWIWLPMMLLWYRVFRDGAPWTHRLLAWLAAPPIMVFALIAAWSSQRILFHWAAPGYLMLFPLLGEAVSVRLQHRWVRRSVGATAGLVLLVLVVIATQIQFDWLGSAPAAVMRRDPTDEALDWSSVRDDLRARGLLPDGAVVATLNWRDGGKLGYALGPDTTMLVLSPDSRQFGFAHPLRDFAGRDLVVLSVDGPDRATAEAAHWFDDVSALPGSSVRLGARVLRPVTVLQGHGLHAGP